jgi:DNA (cytosine-5)-methyltransferase 1
MPELDFINKSLEIKNPPDFTVVSTFAGCGGSSTGYVWAGGKVLLAVEWDKNAVETYRLNYPHTPIYHGDIAKLSVDEALALAGVKPYELDIFDGSPPCQGFSTAGKRQIDDPRNQLFREYIRLLKGFMPKVFVMENVSGMVKGKMKLIFAEILTELKACGYQVSAKLLNAMYLGVPQSRQRMIFIGVRDDLGIAPSHPKPSTRPSIVRDAIGHLPTGVQGKHEPQIIEAWNASGMGVSLRQTRPYVGSFQSYKLDPNQPSRTQIKVHVHWHYEVARELTCLESALLHSFPSGYQFPKQKSEWIARIGNSVPPEMMRRIAEHINMHILKAITDGK